MQEEIRLYSQTVIKKGKHNIKESVVVRVATEVSYFFGYKEHRNKSTTDTRRIQLTADVLIIKVMRATRGETQQLKKY